MTATSKSPRALRQENLDDLVAFISVAENRGFSAAAAKMGISASAVSQAIRNLEVRLGTPLFARTTRSVSLTEAGERYLARVRPAVAEIAEASDELADVPARPRGELRLTVSRAGFLFVLRPLLLGFAAAYPEITLEISVDSALVDIVRDGFDAGIRYSDTVERDMTSVPVGPQLRSYVVAAPAYLARRGSPKRPQDLMQ
ncbi:MAG TPA: LysR family transcriptional regulator, partial [Polyangia bacterium]|nr:LysR family transcriptional regulator [Polyangia bacterium]